MSQAPTTLRGFYTEVYKLWREVPQCIRHEWYVEMNSELHKKHRSFMRELAKKKEEKKKEEKKKEEKKKEEKKKEEKKKENVNSKYYIDEGIAQ